MIIVPKKAKLPVIDDVEAPVKHEPYVNFLDDGELSFLNDGPEILSEDAEELEELMKKHPDHNVEVQLIRFGKIITYTPKKQEG